MKFRDLLNEKYKTTIDLHKNGVYTFEVFENGPNFKKEIKELLRSTDIKGLRIGITDSKRPKMYVWDADILHHIAKDKGKLKFDLGWEYYNETLGTLELDADDWADEIKYKKEMIAMMKKNLPKVKKIETADGYRLDDNGEVIEK